LFSTVVDLILISPRTAHDKDLEILLRRRQLAILDRQRRSRAKLSKSEKLTLAVLTVKLKTIRAGWSDSRLLPRCLTHR
jgi:hypothetical protein